MGNISDEEFRAMLSAHFEDDKKSFEILKELVENASDGRTSMSLWNRWQSWVLASLFTGVMVLVGYSASNVVDLVKLTRDRQVVNENRITILETNEKEHEDFRAAIRQQNEKYETLINALVVLQTQDNDFKRRVEYLEKH